MFVTIGLEVHFRLNARTKLFSSSLVCSKSTIKNIYIDIIDLAFPGSLPCFNKRAVFLSIKFGISINATINMFFSFDRKHYVYPDLPKGFQITQYRHPLLTCGYVDIILSYCLKKRIFIRSAHLEEDTGKLDYNYSKKELQIDFNRCGFSLLEVVTEPIINSAKEASLFLRKLFVILTTLDISDSKMETGSFRCDVNISLKKYYCASSGVRVEIKNINSFNFVEHAIFYEICRQKVLLTSGKFIQRETRYYDFKKEITLPLRFKETFFEYRYFIEPDIPTFIISRELIYKVNYLLDEFLDVTRNRYIVKYELPKRSFTTLFLYKWLYEYFELVSVFTIKYILLCKILINDFLFSISLENNFFIIKPYVTAKVLNLIKNNKMFENNLRKIFLLILQKKNNFYFQSSFLFLTEVEVFNNSFFLYILKHIFIVYYDQICLYFSGNVKILFFILGKIKIFFKSNLVCFDLLNFLENFLKDK